MPGSRKHLLDIVTQELYLPEIDAEACVHAFFDRSDCQACVQVCPMQAWVLDDKTLGLDIDACDGCGLCVPACPSGALHISFPWVIRPFGGQMIALFACDHSGINQNNGLLPCIHALGLKQLLLLYNSGIKYLLVATAECTECTRHQPAGSIHRRLEQLNTLLHERNKPVMKIQQRSIRVWQKIFATDEVISRGTRLSRRGFLSGGGQQLRHQLVVMDPLNLPECRTIPSGQLLPTAEKDELHWPWAPRLDENQCNGCDACIKLCPTDALQLIPDQEDATPVYQLNPASCTGCGVCTTVCELQAISVNQYSLSSPHSIKLLEKSCMACGNTFHLPRQNSQSEAVFCRICQKHNHSHNLFQVLSEH